MRAVLRIQLTSYALSELNLLSYFVPRISLGHALGCFRHSPTDMRWRIPLSTLQGLRIVWYIGDYRLYIGPFRHSLTGYALSATIR